MTLDLTFNEWLQLGSTLLLLAVTVYALIDVDKLRTELRAAQTPADPPTTPITIPSPEPVTAGRHRDDSGTRATRRAYND